MLGDVETFELEVPLEPQVPRALDLPDGEHDDQRDARHEDDARHAADELRLELVDATAVEETLHGGRRVGTVGGRDAVLPRCEQPETQRSPDPGERVHRHRADRVVDAQVLEQVDAETTTTPATAPITPHPNGDTQ